MDEQLVPSQIELAVYVRDPQRLLFKGIANSVTAINGKGIFDVLGTHENFISIIKDKVVIRTKERTMDFPVKQGIIKVEKNIVNIFIGTENL